jgi:hypothetical protein
MASPTNGEHLYRVDFSALIRQEFRDLLRRAIWEGRGEQCREAMNVVFRGLARKPKELGEPLYRLNNLRLSVRLVSVGPILVHFAVHDDYPLVLIKAVDLLPKE